MRGRCAELYNQCPCNVVLTSIPSLISHNSNHKSNWTAFFFPQMHIFMLFKLYTVFSFLNFLFYHQEIIWSPISQRNRITGESQLITAKSLNLIPRPIFSCSSSLLSFLLPSLPPCPSFSSSSSSSSFIYLFFNLRSSMFSRGHFLLPFMSDYAIGYSLFYFYFNFIF